MEKAREHAKKIANERDELKRQNEEKDLKLVQLSKLVASSTTLTDSHADEMRKLQGDFDARDSLAKKLEAQLFAMERHYTKPLDSVVGIVSYRDWVLVKDKSGSTRWWLREVLPSDFSEPVVKLDEQIFSELEKQVLDSTERLSKQESEFEEYRKKVELVLQEKDQVCASGENDSAERIEASKKLIKLSSELEQVKLYSAKMAKQVGTLLAERKEEVGRVSQLNEQISSGEVRFQKCLLQLQEQAASALAEQTHAARKLGTLEKLCDQQKEQLMLIAEKKTASILVQTEAVPALISENTSSRESESPAARGSPSAGSDRSVLLPPSNHDQVAIPLRAQIRDLNAEIDREVREHALTRVQLDLVKSELRKIEAAARVHVDLNDEVKIEYMRNIARRFTQLLPASNCDELEQIIPVILSFFQISPDEAAGLLAQRKPKTFALW